MKWMGNRAGIGWSLGLAALVLGAAVVVPQLRADDAAQGAARLSSVEGQVRIVQDGQVLADPALVNTPLFAGTRIETGDDGKAEIQFDDGSIARLSPDSGLTLTAIANNGVTDLVMEGGLGYFELQGNGPAGDTRITFGDAVVTASSFTVMRIKLDTPPGELAVFSGDARLQRGNAMSVDVQGGQSLALNANNAGQYRLAQSIEPDSWDTWNSDRDQALNAAASDQTDAASSFTGGSAASPQWNDLDANGNWYNVPGQGYVWSPYEASSAGWDPYGCGHWMWTPRFGYIWVSCESWGYLPYSMGAWNYYDGFGWCWAPGHDREWWRGGGYRGVNIITRPRDYHPVPMPSPRGPIGRQVPRIVSVNRGGPDHGGEGLPVRSRNAPVEIGGHTVQPLRPLPTHRYEPTQSGFVYRPSQGNRGAGNAGSNNPGPGNSGPGSMRWGVQNSGNPGANNPVAGNPGTTNRGSGFNGAGSPGGSQSRRDSYTPAPTPQYVPVPRQPTATHNEMPGVNNGAPGNNGTPNGGDTGRPGLGGLVPRDYYRTHPDSGVDRDGNAIQAPARVPNNNNNNNNNFRGNPAYTPSPSSQPSSGGGQRSAPAPAPVQHNSAPAPAPHYNPPAPHMSAPPPAQHSAPAPAPHSGKVN